MGNESAESGKRVADRSVRDLKAGFVKIADEVKFGRTKNELLLVINWMLADGVGETYVGSASRSCMSKSRYLSHSSLL